MFVKSFIQQIKIHPLLIAFIMISILTGTFVDLAIILFIVLFHELGHYIAARYYQWRVHSIVLWVFGGVMKTDEYGSKSIKEEFIVTIAGPFQHTYIYLFVFIFSYLSIIPESILHLISYYNIVILLFNLIPVWPLDGGKVVFLLGSLFFPYRQAYDQTIILSMFICLLLIMAQLIFFPFNLSSLLIIVFLLIENGRDWKNRHYVFIRFLLHRYQLEKNTYRLRTIVVTNNMPLKQVIQKFYQGKQHLVHIVDTNREKIVTINELTCLKLYFEKRYFRQPIGKLIS